MVTFVIDSDSTTQQTLSSNDAIIIYEGRTLTAASGYPIFTTSTTEQNLYIHVAGNVWSGGSAIALFSDSSGNGSGVGAHDIFIAATGSVSSISSGAIYLRGSGNVVTNYGDISTMSHDDAAVSNFGTDVALRNHGTITGFHGIKFQGYTTLASTANCVNTGLIQGENRGITATAALFLNNSGTVVATNVGGYGTGIYVHDTVGTVGSEIFNSGTISGQATAILIATNDNLVTNTGSIIGNVYFGGGADTYDGRGGTLNGTIFGGHGGDTYIVDDSSISLLEEVGEGTDLVKSKVSFALGDNFENLTLLGSGNNSGIGNGEQNTLTGNIGNNTLRGKGGADIVNGGDGDDRLYGGGGGDTLGGGADDDVLRGGKGNDTLNGGGENDVLVGGAGKDNLTGGSGEDVFRFVKANHSLDSSLADSILDFTSGDDLIDLGAFAGKLKFIGSSGFSGDGEVRVTEAGGNSTVRVDVDSDGVADMKIKVLGVVGLDALDFLL